MSKLVIKIGGSFLTKKAFSDDFPTSIEEIQAQRDRFIETDHMETISNEIHEVAAKHSIMIVHGAGPFGHALVDDILSGIPLDPLDVHKSMLILNSALSSHLAQTGLKCETVSPLNTASFDGDYRTGELVCRMKTILQGGRLPISHGDLVPTISTRGRLGDYEVISGDVVVRDLAIGWPADKMVMITDVDGILDRDPALENAERIPETTYGNCLDLLEGRMGKGADVTGGIGQKIRYCEKPISLGIPLQIISGANKGHLLAASEGAKVGTTISLR